MPEFSLGITLISQVISAPPADPWGTSVERMLAIYLDIRIVFNPVVQPHSVPARQLDTKWVSWGLAGLKGFSECIEELAGMIENINTVASKSLPSLSLSL